MRKSLGSFLLAAAVAIMTLSSCSKEEKIKPEKTYRNEILVAPFPKLGSPGGLNGGNLNIIDYNGNTIMSKNLPYAAVDFKRWIINGEVRYTYIEHDPTLPRLPVGYVPGAAVVLDEDFNEVNRFYLKPYNGRTEADPKTLGGHDFILIDDNHYIAMAYYGKHVNNIPESLNPVPDAWVTAAIIQEVKDGEVIWEWDCTNYPEMYETSVELNFFSQPNAMSDYAHMNSMFIDSKDNNLVLSFRNMDQVVKINRHTGDIIWRLGGKNSDFAMTDDQKFLRQHHATYTDEGTLLLFDNGQRDQRPYSRVVEFTLDEASKTITGFHKIEFKDRFFEYMGSVQKINGAYFLGCGSEDAGSEITLLEVDANTGEVLFEKEYLGNSYRAFKY